MDDTGYMREYTEEEVERQLTLDDLQERTQKWEGLGERNYPLLAYRDSHRIITVGTGIVIDPNHSASRSNVALLKKHFVEYYQNNDPDLTLRQARNRFNSWLRNARSDADLTGNLRQHPIPAEVNNAAHMELLEKKLDWVETNYPDKIFNLNYLQKSVIADLFYQGGENFVGAGSARRAPTNFYKAVRAGEWNEAIYQLEYESNPNIYRPLRPNGANGIQNRMLERVSSLDIARGGTGSYSPWSELNQTRDSRGQSIHPNVPNIRGRRVTPASESTNIYRPSDELDIHTE